MEAATPQNRFYRAISRVGKLPRWRIAAICFGQLVIIGIIDYLTGYEVTCTVFYLLPIWIAAWFVGADLGILMGLLSAFSGSATNILAGEVYHNRFAPFWNAAIIFCVYVIIVWLLRSLREIQDTLERRVQDRTAKLYAELTERKRLEKEILDVTDREQRRIGMDIHDSLCQHLTGTALAEQFLAEKLSARGAQEVEDADRVIELLEEAISMARNLAAGLYPIETEGEGLLTALGDLAGVISRQFKVNCQFASEEQVLVQGSSVSMQLYRIVQEAVQNAIRHGKARNIDIRLDREGEDIQLSVTDDGIGLGEGIPASQGMGLRNMKYRASMVGGNLTLESGAQGAVVRCTFREGVAALAHSVS
jgi:signal transduction histidine kinase